MHYPSSSEIDAWCEQLFARAAAVKFTASTSAAPAPTLLAVRHEPEVAFVRFEPADDVPFYGIWQPAAGGGPAPLLLHVPGYGAEMSVHPELVAAGYNVLHINPRGYCTPQGFDETKRPGGVWPVLPDTVRSGGESGYVDWLTDALVAWRWAISQPSVQPRRLATFGTSQGGGGTLLLGSILRDRGIRAVAADLPFLTDFRQVQELPTPGAYGLALEIVKRLEADAPQQLHAAWHALGLIDTLSHAPRLTMPVMLTAGTEDQATPPPTIRALFDQLSGTRAYVELAGQGHAYTVPFMTQALGWFRTWV